MMSSLVSRMESAKIAVRLSMPHARMVVRLWLACSSTAEIMLAVLGKSIGQGVEPSVADNTISESIFQTPQHSLAPWIVFALETEICGLGFVYFYVAQANCPEEPCARENTTVPGADDCYSAV